MNRLSKIIVLLGLCLMCIGLLLSSGNFKTLVKPFYNSDDYNKKEYSINSSDISKLIVNSFNEKIKVVPATGNEIIITYYESNSFRYEIENTNDVYTLKKERKARIQFFNYNIFEPDIVIEIPANLTLDYDLKTSNSGIEFAGLNMYLGEFKSSNGSIKINDSNIQNNLKLTTSNAKISLENIKGQDIVSKTSNGDINLSNVTSGTINLHTSNSSIRLKAVTTQKSIDVKTSNGRINFSSLYAPSINLKTSNAEIEGNIIGLYSDYTRQLITSFGEVSVNGATYGKKITEPGNKNYSLTAKTSNDDIDITFTN